MTQDCIGVPGTVLMYPMEYRCVPGTIDVAQDCIDVTQGLLMCPRDCIDVAQGMNKWGAAVNVVMNLLVPLLAA